MMVLQAPTKASATAFMIPAPIQAAPSMVSQTSAMIAPANPNISAVPRTAQVITSMIVLTAPPSV